MEESTNPPLIDQVFGETFPIFGDDFRKDNITWKHIKPLPYDILGRVLVCHLLLEIHIEKFIEVQAKDFNIKKADLSFSQKLAMISSYSIIVDANFYPGLVTVNKIRNKLVHNLMSELEQDDIKIIVDSLKGFNKKNKKKEVVPTQGTHTDAAIIEHFTVSACSFLAGACSMYVQFAP